jgi:hypothetical protein
MQNLCSSACINVQGVNKLLTFLLLCYAFFFVNIVFVIVYCIVNYDSCRCDAYIKSSVLYIYVICSGGHGGGYGGGRRDNYRDGGHGPNRNQGGGSRPRPY